MYRDNNIINTSILAPSPQCKQDRTLKFYVV